MEITSRQRPWLTLSYHHRFTFETATGRGKGLVRLQEGKCWTLLTTLQVLMTSVVQHTASISILEIGPTSWTLPQELKGYEENEFGGAGPNANRAAGRPKGVEHGTYEDRLTWSEQKAHDEATLGLTPDSQPYVVIVGGGQGGIALAARLKVRSSVP